MRNYILTLLISISAVACSQSSDRSRQGSKENATNSEVVFDTLLNQSAIRIVDLTAPGGLGRISDFMAIYDNPDKYKADVKRVLASPEYSELKKQICIYSMQKLDFDQYYDFTNYCLQLFENDKISEADMRLVIMPGPWKTERRYPEKHKDPKVQELLKKMLATNKLSQAGTDEVNRILSGQTLKNMQSVQNR